ncbi:MAG TPA: cell division protein, partial [Cellvibrionales bacterium]|nr:cell division protein [Cellvibrionales bacterium]
MANKNRFNKWSWRVYPLWIFLLVALVAIIVRLGQLQVTDSERGRLFLQQQGDARVLRTEKIPASRGEIVDRNGELLAISTPVKSVWVNPSLVDKSDTGIQRLATAVAMSEKAVRKRLSSKSQFVYLKRQLDPQKADRIRDLELEGVFFETEYKRFYPAGEVASHLVGFTGVDEHGQEGIELSYDSLLTAEDGVKQVMKNAHHDIIKDIKLVKAATEG